MRTAVRLLIPATTIGAKPMSMRSRCPMCCGSVRSVADVGQYAGRDLDHEACIAAGGTGVGAEKAPRLFSYDSPTSETEASLMRRLDTAAHIRHYEPLCASLDPA